MCQHAMKVTYILPKLWVDVNANRTWYFTKGRAGEEQLYNLAADREISRRVRHASTTQRQLTDVTTAAEPATPAWVSSALFNHQSITD